MHAFEVLADPVRRRILELLAGSEQSSGALTEVIRAEFGISQPAVSQQLKVLRDNGFATVRADGTRRLYAIDPTGPAKAEEWLVRLRSPDAAAFWNQRLDAFATELARGRRARAAATVPRQEKETA